MSNDIVSAVQRLFDECQRNGPELNRIDEYINECRTKNEDMNILLKDPLLNDNLTPLHVACRKGHFEIVERLLDSKNNFRFSVNVNAIDKYYKTALHYSCNAKVCERKCPLTVRILLQHPNIEVNKVNGYGSTPLHFACESKNNKTNTAIVMELLKHPDIQVAVKNNYGSIPLHAACSHRFEETSDIIQMLIRHQ